VEEVVDKVRYEIDQFKARMANIYSLPDFLKTEHTLLGHINSAIKTTSVKQLLAHLRQIETLIQESLTQNTKKLRGGTNRTDFLKKNKLEDKGYSLKELAKISGEPLKTLQEVYNRGIGAYKTNPQSVRMKGSFKKGVNAPMSQKLSKEQWAMSRIYSYLTKGHTQDDDLRGGADSATTANLFPDSSSASGWSDGFYFDNRDYIRKQREDAKKSIEDEKSIAKTKGHRKATDKPYKYRGRGLDHFGM
jgi:hypothetical protein